jgi:hypothetical protein
MDKKIKVSLAALLLSLVLPGLGQVYAGRLIRGILFFLLTTILCVGWVVYFLHPAIKISPYGVVAIAFSLVLFLFCTVDSYLLVKRYNAAHKLGRVITPGKRGLLIVGIFTVMFIYFLAAWFLQRNLCRSFTALPDSMEPTIYKGERVFVDLRAYKKSGPQRGDVVLLPFLLVFVHDATRLYSSWQFAFAGEFSCVTDDAKRQDIAVQIMTKRPAVVICRYRDEDFILELFQKELIQAADYKKLVSFFRDNYKQKVIGNNSYYIRNDKL